MGHTGVQKELVANNPIDSSRVDPDTTLDVAEIDERGSTRRTRLK